MLYNLVFSELTAKNFVIIVENYNLIVSNPYTYDRYNNPNINYWPFFAQVNNKNLIRNSIIISVWYTKLQLRNFKLANPKYDTAFYRDSIHFISWSYSDFWRLPLHALLGPYLATQSQSRLPNNGVNGTELALGYFPEGILWIPL